jgi:hypothetical protein
MLNDNHPKQTSGIVRYSCGLLFMLFTFSYLFFLQGNVLAETQYIYSHGLTTYSILMGSVLITLILQTLQWIVGRVFKPHASFHVLSYLPSFILLAFVTSSRYSLITTAVWMWMLPFLLVFSLALLLILKSRFSTPNLHPASIATLLWKNHLVLFILFLLCGTVSTLKDVYCYELKAERLIMEQDYEAATQVAPLSLKTTRRLTELRMFALSQQEQLAERLFDFPQYHGAAGLLCLSDTSLLYRYPVQRICYRLGALPDSATIHSEIQYLQVMNRIDTLRTAVTQDYELCYYLLDKDLNSFAKKLPLYYPDAPTTPLPRAYREAVLYLTKTQKKHFKYTLSSEAYEQYQQLKSEYTDAIEQKNQTRRQFGNTFWWYYEYGD